MSRDALVVGINTYNYDRLTKLQAPAHDAEAIAQLLESGEFKVKRLPGVKDKQNNTIRVGKTTQVSLTQLEEAIVQLFKPEGRNIPDTALLYFSGHGLRKDRGIQEGYLATSDVNPDLGNWGIRLKWLRELLQESPVRQQIIWLDCCYSGELLNFAEADPGDRGKGRDRCFIAASREFEVAYETIDSKHSVLTEALLQGLDPRGHSGTWVTNYTLIDILNQRLQAFPQSPIFANSGGAINLTRTSQAPNLDTNSVVTTICPYRGLQYFDCTEEDAQYFYGREALTDQLLEKVRVGNFLAVLGASGSGKSSVVRAGLLYQLTLGRRLSGSDTWQIRIFRPGEHPLESLALVFVDANLSAVERAKQLGDAEDLIAQGATGLRRLVQSSPSRVMLVVDQFEEVFTLCHDGVERQKFFECLLGMTSPLTPPLQGEGNRTPPSLSSRRCANVGKGAGGLGLCVIMTMRADFFNKCAEYDKLTQQIQENLVTVTPMTEEELRQAITEPAKQVDLQIEPELVNQMIVDVEGSPGSLPLLQYTLTELWQQRSEEKLTISAYTRLGGVKGTLQKRATEIYESLSPEEQAAAKRIFLELTQLGEGTEDTRRRVLLQDLITSQPSNNVEQVIQKLADAKLIVTSTLIEKGAESGKVAVVDVAHEALIRHWSLLGKWLDENRDRLKEKRKIEVAAEEWRSQRKARDYLLRGRQLKIAKAWLKEERDNLAFSPLAKEFIQASLKYQQRALLITASWLTIPIVVAFAAIAPYLRQQGYEAALQRIKNPKQPGTKQALELLSEGCWISKRIQGNLTTALFGKCHDITDTDLRGANLSYVNLSSTDLTGADLTGANLLFANLSHTFLFRAKFTGADLRFTKLNGYLVDADFTGADFTGADLANANLVNANLTGANLANADLANADLTGANLTGANLTGADLSYFNLYKTNLTNADLSFANLTNANLHSANLTNANLHSANLKNALYTKTTKLPKNFDPAKEQMLLIAPGINLSGADLSFINFSFTGEVFDFGGINLTNANLEGSDLTSVSRYLTPEQVKAAKNWEKAIYDEEFRKKLGLK